MPELNYEHDGQTVLGLIKKESRFHVKYNGKSPRKVNCFLPDYRKAAVPLEHCGFASSHGDNNLRAVGAAIAMRCHTYH